MSERVHPPIINMWSTMEKEKLRGEIRSMRATLERLWPISKHAMANKHEVVHVACAEAIEVIQEHLEEATDMWAHDYAEETP